MMGPLEFYKWPQDYDAQCSFAMAAPGNPDLLEFPSQTFPITDTAGVLPRFSDPNATWFHIEGVEFELSDSFPTGDYGRLKQPVIKRLQSALTEIFTLIEEAMTRTSRKLEGLSGKEVEDMQGRLEICQKMQGRLTQSYMKLNVGDLTPFETMLLFREYQRMLLGLRGWLIYNNVIWPRLRRNDKDYSDSPLPLRGTFCDEITLCSALVRAGVPVWYIRHGMTMRPPFTVVHRSTLCVPATLAFSSTTVMRLGRFHLNAPAWVPTPEDDDIGLNSLVERLEKVSVSNFKLIDLTKKYNPVLASHIFKNTVEHAFDLDAGAPALTVDSVDLAPYTGNDSVADTLATMKKSAEKHNQSWPGMPLHRLICVHYDVDMISLQNRMSRMWSRRTLCPSQ